MCPLKRCAAVVANQLWSSAAQRAHGRRAVCLFSPFANTEPRLIQHHSPFLLSTPGGGPRHLANTTGDKLYGVLNGYLMAKFCHLNFTYTQPQSLKDLDRTLSRHYNAFNASFLCALSILYKECIRLLLFAQCNGRYVINYSLINTFINSAFA